MPEIIQILIHLFVDVFAVGMVVYAIHLFRQKRQLQDDSFFLQLETDRLNSLTHALQFELTEEEDERRRFAAANFRLHRELDSTHRMIAMLMRNDLENNVTFDNIAVEIGRNGVNYKFSNKEDADEGDRRPDEESKVASRYSP